MCTCVCDTYSIPSNRTSPLYQVLLRESRKGEGTRVTQLWAGENGGKTVNITLGAKERKGQSTEREAGSIGNRFGLCGIIENTDWFLPLDRSIFSLKKINKSASKIFLNINIFIHCWTGKKEILRDRSAHQKHFFNLCYHSSSISIWFFLKVSISLWSSPGALACWTPFLLEPLTY